MRVALAAAQQALDGGEAPIGCVIARADGSVIGSDYNRMRQSGNLIAHAEIVTFATIAGRVEPGETGLQLVSTLEPCVMCTGAAMQAGIATITYGLRAPADSGTGRVRPPESPGATWPAVTGDILAGESRALFLEWLARHRDDPSREAQRVFIEQLLALTEGQTGSAGGTLVPSALPDGYASPLAGSSATRL